MDTEFSSGMRRPVVCIEYVLKCIKYSKITISKYLRAAFFQNPDRVSVDDVSDSAYTAFSIRWLAVQNAGHPGAETEI